MPGPLNGVRILELGGIGPGPFAGMMLADHGADVIRIDRPKVASGYRDVVDRSRRSMILDIKKPGGAQAVAALARTADGLIEGFRPGVMERLGLGPDRLLEENPRLVYGRMTGWGQTGPLAAAAGHDINYIALSGALHAMGGADEKPPVPLNLVGDYGGGGMLLAFGMVSALLAARTTGQGQVVDAAISDGAALLMSMFCSPGALVPWEGPRGSHMLTGAAYFYDTYETSDRQFVAIGAIEGQFYALLLDRLGLTGDPDFSGQLDQASWPRAKERLAAIFRMRTRDEWSGLLEGTDACFAPVLSLEEAAEHPHNVARGTFVDAFGLTQPAPAPRYSRDQTVAPTYRTDGRDGRALLEEADYSPSGVDQLIDDGVLHMPRES
ncbi:MAG TPA: CaiB/BaiF CoA-transferase family protein [Sphingobium sp.]